MDSQLQRVLIGRNAGPTMQAKSEAETVNGSGRMMSTTAFSVVAQSALDQMWCRCSTTAIWIYT
ncbi:MAG: hypothetical protein AAF937_06100 [Planctomycetota bacterium]